MGFHKNAGTVTSVNNVAPVNGNVTLTIPSAVTETTVSGWGFTKNAGTITGIKMNNASKGTSGVVDLGTVITSHQSLDSCVKTSGNQTIAGTKTFSSTIAGSINGNSATTDRLKDGGAQTALSAQNSKPAAGLSVYRIYNNGYPCSYGNLLSIGGTGQGQIAAEWSGANAGTGHLYYRNKRDNDTCDWSAWSKVAFESDLDSALSTLATNLSKATLS